jgi:methyltransferase-like protein
MELAEKNGLNYLCDAEFFSSKSHWYSQQAQQALAPFLNDRFKLEAYIDMFSNRTFRHSLLVKDTNKVTAATVENLKQFATINFAGTYQQTTTNGTLTEVKAESFKSATGNSINASFPITKSAFQVLSKIYPATLNFDELYVQAEKLLVEEYKYKADTQDKERLLNDLAAVFNWNAIELHYVSVGIATSVPQKPKASDYTRWEAENGKNRITNLRHESLVINDATRLLIFLCDGTRTIDDLTNEMVRRTSNGLIQLPDAFAAPKNANNKAHLEACQKYIAAALPELVLKAIWIQE